jgi:hypothetical protein
MWKRYQIYIDKVVLLESGLTVCDRGHQAEGKPSSSDGDNRLRSVTAIYYVAMDKQKGPQYTTCAGIRSVLRMLQRLRKPSAPR